MKPTRLLSLALLTLLPLAGCLENVPNHKKKSGDAAAGKGPQAAALVKQDAPPPPDDPLTKLSDRLRGVSHPGERPLETALKTGLPKQQSPVTPTDRKPATVAVRCPEGTVAQGKAPPEGTSQWCEKPASFGSGEKEGPYIRWDRNGNKVLEMAYHKGKPNGPTQTFYPNGQPAELKTFRDGAIDGPWIKWDKTGLKAAEGGYFNGKKNGKFTYWGKDDVILAQGSYREDIRDGTWLRYFGSGDLRSKVTFREGMREGPAEDYYSTGQISARGAYHLNKLEGVWTMFYPNGQKKAEGSFANGRRIGLWTKFRPDGRPNQQRDLGDREFVRHGGAHAPVPLHPADHNGFVGM